MQQGFRNATFKVLSSAGTVVAEGFVPFDSSERQTVFLKKRIKDHAAEGACNASMYCSNGNLIKEIYPE